MAMPLAEVLNATWSADSLPIVHRRRHCRAAAFCKFVPRPSEVDMGPRTLLLMRTWTLSRMRRWTWPWLCRPELRARGRSYLASRASKVSKFRNTVCHPEVGLQDAIVKALGVPTAIDRPVVTASLLPIGLDNFECEYPFATTDQGLHDDIAWRVLSPPLFAWRPKLLFSSPDATARTPQQLGKLFVMIMTILLQMNPGPPAHLLPGRLLFRQTLCRR